MYKLHVNLASTFMHSAYWTSYAAPEKGSLVRSPGSAGLLDYLILLALINFGTISTASIGSLARNYHRYVRAVDSRTGMISAAWL